MYSEIDRWIERERERELNSIGFEWLLRRVISISRWIGNLCKTNAHMETAAIPDLLTT